MTKLRVEGNPLGTGSVTLSAPNTNSDITLNLPAASGDVVTTTATQTLTNKSIDGSQITGVLTKDFYLSPVLITQSYVVPSGFNAMTAGPIEIDTGVEVEVSVDSTWTVV
jgi:hypothetical protein